VSEIALSDPYIQALVDEQKPAIEPSVFFPTAAKLRHLRADVEVEGGSGSKFKVVVRQREDNPLDFSVILGYQMPESSRLFRLRRFNGLSHQHTNPIEHETFYAYHVHEATERYQALPGRNEEHCATPTDAYVDLRGAIDHMLETAGFDPPAQLRMDRV